MPREQNHRPNACSSPNTIITTTSTVAGIAITTTTITTITWQSRARKPDDLASNSDETRTRAGAWVRSGVELNSYGQPKPASADLRSARQKTVS
jgi:hypothetical protein